MIDQRGVLTCDVCGRQIVSMKVSDKYCIWREGTILLDINKHVCRECKNDPLLREQEGLDEIR